MEATESQCRSITADGESPAQPSSKKQRNDSEEREQTRYVGRLAPSPSGHLHIGHAQTFSIARDRALAFGGDLLLRVEDIDVQRCKPQYLADMVEDLGWFGIHWNRGFLRENSSLSLREADQHTLSSSSLSTQQQQQQQSEYVQSKRFALYAQAWRVLYERGFLYPCTHSRKDVEQALSAPHDHLSSLSSAASVSMSAVAAESGEVIFPSRLRPDYVQRVPFGVGNNAHFPAAFQGLRAPSDCAQQRVNWRFRVPDDGVAVRFTDVCCGEHAFTPGRDFGDFLVWRSDGFPAYELAVVVDDLLQGVTEVVRGQDLLLSTARQLLVIQALFGLCWQRDEHWWPARPREHWLYANAKEVNSGEESSEGRGGRESVENNSNSSNDENMNININTSSTDGGDDSLFSSRRYRIPRYFHAPLMLDERGVRMAKRNFSKSLRKLREESVSPAEIRAQFFNKEICSHDA